MNAVLLCAVSIFCFLAAYFTYGRFIQRRIFRVRPDEPVPSRLREDGVDFVPTRPGILFGHHFVSIAGLGPILGPAIGVIWGWLPAVLWVLLGTIFFGAVHDLGTLIISMRSEGRPIGEIVRDTVGFRAGTLFMLIILFLLALAMGVFAYLVAVLFTSFYPESVLPVAALMPIAVLIGYLIYRRNFPSWAATGLGLILMFAAVDLGLRHPVHLYRVFLPTRTAVLVDSLPGSGLPEPTAAALEEGGYRKDAALVRAAAGRARDAWILILLGYSFLASVLPVWLLLQPRDYLNSFQLYLGMILIGGGLVLASPDLAAPAVFAGGEGAPPLFPFLFIVIACGAISGFHSLVATGTTVRQLSRAGQVGLVGYAPMLLEGLLAILAVVVCTARSELFPGPEAWVARYRDFAALDKLGPKLDVFISASGGFISSLGISGAFARGLVAVVVVSFAMTTLDSGTRLLRYDIEALGRTFKIKFLGRRFPAGTLSVLCIGYFALMKISGQPAGMALWELFGSANQILAALGLLAVCAFLFVRRGRILPFLIPMALMLVFSLSALAAKLPDFYRKGSITMFVTGLILLGLTVWLLAEVFVLVRLFRFGRSGGPRRG